MNLMFSVDRDGWTKQIQLCIGDENTGYRIAGPKYNGRSRAMLTHVINRHDAEEIRRWLDAAFPPETKNTKDHE